MQAEEFVSGVYSVVVDENNSIFRRLFEETQPESVTDPYWKRALAFFDALSPEQKPVFFEILRQTSIAAGSTVLGIIDGAVFIKDGAPGFSLLSGRDRIDGDLQALFLTEQEARQTSTKC